MSDLISREAAIEAFEKFIHEIGIEDAPYNYGEIALCEANVPSAERVGKWIINMSDYKSTCSVCGADETEFIHGTEMWYGIGKSKFCPNCGSQMEVKG